MRRRMSDPSRERVALTDAFLMFLLPLATPAAICLSWMSLCFMDVCSRRWGRKSGHKLRQPCKTHCCVSLMGQYRLLTQRILWSCAERDKRVPVQQRCSSEPQQLLSGSAIQIAAFMELWINRDPHFDDMHPYRMHSKQTCRDVQNTEYNALCKTHGALKFTTNQKTLQEFTSSRRAFCTLRLRLKHTENACKCL